MRFVMECTSCGNWVNSPEGREPTELEEAVALIDELGLTCTQCGGEVTVRIAEGGA